MGRSLAAVHAPLSVPKRWLLFGVAVVVGAVSGNRVNIEPLGWAYYGLLNVFAGPGIEINSLAAGVGLGFVIGFIHLTSI
jgi:hypothetical protein